MVDQSIAKCPREWEEKMEPLKDEGDLNNPVEDSEGIQKYALSFL